MSDDPLSAMRVIKGVAAAPGVAMGTARFFGSQVRVHERYVELDQRDAELAKIDKGVAIADAQLERIQRLIAEAEGDNHQEYQIIEAHRLMLKDAHLIGEARKLIEAHACAAGWAVQQALDKIRAVFERIEDPYFRERKSDIDSVGERLLHALAASDDDKTESTEQPSDGIVFSHDLSPADMTMLGRGGVDGFLTEAGGKTSHATVIARALGKPLVVGVSEIVAAVRPGMQVIVDGTRGEVILNPDEEAVCHYRSRAERERARADMLSNIRHKSSETLDGLSVHLAANVELIEEVPIAVELGAESIGLFRTEFLYLDRADLPSEEEHYEHILMALKALEGRTATFRTLDLGGDKLPASVRIPAGANPAMGLRSIRYGLWERSQLKAQIRALFRASLHGSLRILIPMISGVSELRLVKAIYKEVREELIAEGVPLARAVPLGVMVETPSAALVTEWLARECDFLTIGTNDLIQYAMAADRQDEHVGYLYHPLHPAIVRLLGLIADGARAAGKPLAMCGDMAGDPLFLWVLLGLGVHNLSMSPRQIPLMKSVVRRSQFSDAKALVQQIRGLSTEDEVEYVVEKVMESHFPELSHAQNEAIVA